jgi:oxygen-independent coproporphyrinogen-3 oxidase
MINNICSEAIKQKKYLMSAPVNTIYFGGGTPSILSISQIEKIVDTLTSNFNIENNIEFTFEANPDDLTLEYLKTLRSFGINRLSIGIQSFFDEDLLWMNRRHNSKQALSCLNDAQNAGFDNINIDLIYGLPNSTLNNWEQNLNIFKSLSIPHLSAYHLTIEPKTILGVWKKKGKITDIAEKDSIDQYNLLLEKTESWGFLNYEISNFCKEGFYSKHNLNYWNQGKYLGLGPSAHSFNRTSRQWNISVNQQYIDKIQNNEFWFEKEELTLSDRLNDYLLTRLRTMWGINLKEIEMEFGDFYSNYILNEAKKFIMNNLLEVKGDKLILTNKGKFVANMVISELMYVE